MSGKSTKTFRHHLNFIKLTESGVFMNKSIFFFILCLLLTSCSPEILPEPTAISFEVQNHVTTVEELPLFLDKVGPSPDSRVNLISYQQTLNSEFPYERGVYVTLRPDQVDDYSQPIPESIIQRTILFIDGIEIKQDLLMVASGGMDTTVLDEKGDVIYTGDMGPYFLSWAVPLEIGQHQAKLKIVSNTGQINTYNWEFRISEEN